MVAPKNGSSSSPRDKEEGGSPSATPSIHFGGEWPEEGKAVVRSAIVEVEARRSTDDEPRIGATWICTLVNDPPQFFLFASRHGVEGVVQARSFERLAEEIKRHYRFQ